MSRPYWFRIVEVGFGLLASGISLIIITNPAVGAQNLEPLLALALIFSAVRMIAAGGLRRRLKSLESLGQAGAGIIALVLIIGVLLVPGLSLQTLIFLLAVSLAIQGLGRVLYAAGRAHPAWLRGSSLTAGVVMVLLAVLVDLVKGVALLTLVELLALTVLVSGAEAVVSALGPTNPKQITLLKLITFAAFYGIIFVNWIDLFNGGAYIYVVPAYHLWVILAYMIPFVVLLVIRGRKDWELALSLGLLASLGNDLGYFVVGDAYFGFSVNLLDWYAHQFGLYGTTTLFVFNGGFFSFDVPSWLMGAAIYARMAVVILSLRRWWQKEW
ncbi:MAG: hypothetical protein JRN35_10645 [Nitrososphaerota archaeon]|nr:hypothetical protein [Nitrososphaerota archaeon]